MTQMTATKGVLEADTFEPDDDTLSEQEMDDVCAELVASSQAYTRGEIPTRETKYEEGVPYSCWRFKDGYASDLYTLLIKPRPNLQFFEGTVVELPGYAVLARTQEEALTTVRRELNRWMDELVSAGKDIPLPSLLLTRPASEREAA